MADADSNHFKKIRNCHISSVVQPIATECGRMMHVDPVDHDDH